MVIKRPYSEEGEQSRNRAVVEESDSERSERESGEQSSSSQESRGSESPIAEQNASERESGEQSSISDQSSGSPSVAQESDSSSAKFVIESSFGFSTTHISPPNSLILDEQHSSSSTHSTQSSHVFLTPESSQAKTPSPSPDMSPSSESFLDKTDTDFLANKNYRIIKNLGSGTFGSVYEAKNTQTNQTVAIKVLKTCKVYITLALINSLVKTTERLLEIRHKNIVENYEYNRNDVHASQSIHRLYIVREFTELPDLSHALRIENSLGNQIWWPLDEYQARHLIRGIANGVHHMHENGMSHSDLKLNNVLLFWSNKATAQQRSTSMSDILTRDKYLTYELIPKVTDFDKCKIRNDSIDPEGMIMETIVRSHENYCAPECYRGVAYDLIKADCYSIGCCLMAMLLASHPFDEPLGAENPEDTDPDYEIKRKIYLNRCNQIKMDMNYIRQLIKHMSLPLRRVMEKLLDANSETRITIEQFLSDQWFSQSLEESYKTERFTDHNRNFLQDV